MNREDIIRMAREAGLHLPYWDDDQDPKTDPPLGWSCVSPIGKPLERFAALVSAAEREACAKVRERLPAQQDIDVRDQCAAAIRARGKNANR